MPPHATTPIARRRFAAQGDRGRHNLSLPFDLCDRFAGLYERELVRLSVEADAVDPEVASDVAEEGKDDLERVATIEGDLVPVPVEGVTVLGRFSGAPYSTRFRDT